MLRVKKLLLLMVATFFVVTSSGCGGGGGGNGAGSSNNPEVDSGPPSTLGSEPTPPVTPTTPIRGQFKDANVEGLEYRTSGGKAGITDSDGMFTCEDGGTVTFSVGGVVIGTSQCKLVVTPVDLVPGGSIDSAQVQNIVRFLLVLDEDGDRSNGIKISEPVRQAAQDWTVDFSASNFAASVNSIIQDIAEYGNRTVTSGNDARDHLQDTLRCSYSGVYTGTVSGDDPGRFGILVDSRTGRITSVSYSTLYDEFTFQQGTRVISPEQGGVTFSGRDEDGGFEGHFTSVDMITGSWNWEDPEDSDNVIDETGTFSGERIGSDRNAKYRVTGFWDNPSDSEDYGFFAFDVDGQGQLTGVGYSIGEDELFRGDGTANIDSGRLVAMAGGETITGTLHPDGSFSGTASEPGQATPGNLNGSWCQLNHGPDDDSAPTAGPDLVVQAPSVSDSSPNEGASFTLSAAVRNQGDGGSVATTLRYYRSSDATISTEDTEVGMDAVGALSASGTSNESIGLTAPSDAGTYYYGACVEPVSGESDTGNNCSGAVSLSVEESGSDEIPIDGGVDDGSGAVSGEVTVCSGEHIFSTTFRVTMRGTVQAHRAVSSLRLTGYVDGAFLGVDFIGSLSAGESEDFTISGIISTSATNVTCTAEWNAFVLR